MPDLAWMTIPLITLPLIWWRPDKGALLALAAVAWLVTLLIAVAI